MKYDKRKKNSFSFIYLGHVSFTQARNTPFAGLAADGAKLALWNLTHVGYKIVGFVHDEIIIELPLEANSEINATNNGKLQHQIKIVERIVCQSMQELCGEVPVACSWFLAERWSKGHENPVWNTGCKYPLLSLLLFSSSSHSNGLNFSLKAQVAIVQRKNIIL